MNKSGYTEKGFKRKLALEALFGKVFYLSEVSGLKQSILYRFFFSSQYVNYNICHYV